MATMTDIAERTDSAHLTGHLPYLDGWRGIAIALVLAGHFMPSFGLNPAPLGVNFFFVLSGRLMAEILFVRASRFDMFYQRRFSRIYPALVALAFALLALTPFLPKLRVGWPEVLMALTFTFNYFGVITGEKMSALGHVWSLCVEEHAYIILTLIAFSHRRWNTNVPLVLAVITVASMINLALRSYLATDPSGNIGFYTDTRIGSIFASVALYLWMRPKLYKIGSVWLAALPIVAGLLGVALSTFAAPGWVRSTVAPVFLAISVCSIDVAYPFVIKMLSLRFITMIGVWSYSLYLWQQPLMAFRPSHQTYDFNLMAMAFIPALISFYLIEKPARNAINHAFAFRRRLATA